MISVLLPLLIGYTGGRMVYGQRGAVVGAIATMGVVVGSEVPQFLGGIHEIYFPYVLMKPRMILAVISGGFVGNLIFVITGAGLVATPSPGSIFAYFIETPRGGWFGVYLGVILATATSFAVGSMLLGFGRLEKDEADAAADGSAEIRNTDGGAAEPVATGAPAPAPAAPASSGAAPVTGPPATASEL